MTPDLPQTEMAIVEMTNVFRRENGLGDVKPNPALTAAARAFAQYMARTSKFAHEADGRSPSDRVKEQGYRFCTLAENLAYAFDGSVVESRKLAGTSVEGWKNSPGHRANMLLGPATDIGVGVARAQGDPAYYAVQLFARPDSLMLTFRIENRSGTTVRYSIGRSTHRISPGKTEVHGGCGSDPLRFEPLVSAQSVFDPRNGDRYVLQGRGAGSIMVDVQRK